MNALFTKRLLCLAGGLPIVILALALVGCEKPPEKVLDIEAPGVDIEIHKSDDGSSIEVEGSADES